jgi:hypothetical protein
MRQPFLSLILGVFHSGNEVKPIFENRYYKVIFYGMSSAVFMSMMSIKVVVLFCYVCLLVLQPLQTFANERCEALLGQVTTRSKLTEMENLIRERYRENPNRRLIPIKMDADRNR